MSGTDVGPPRLVDFTCHVSEPDSGAAACHLTLKLENKEGKLPSSSEDCSTRTIAMELKPSTLNTLLDGLGRIRDQLSSVSKK